MTSLQSERRIVRRRSKMACRSLWNGIQFFGWLIDLRQLLLGHSQESQGRFGTDLHFVGLIS